MYIVRIVFKHKYCRETHSITILSIQREVLQYTRTIALHLFPSILVKHLYFVANVSMQVRLCEHKHTSNTIITGVTHIVLRLPCQGSTHFALYVWALAVGLPGDVAVVSLV